MDEKDRKTLDIAAPGAPHPDAVDRAIAVPPTLGNQPLARTEPLGALSIKTDPFGPKQPTLGSGLAGFDPLPLPAQSATTGRDASGTITADSAQAAMAAPMQRPGGIFGTMDGKGVNQILARENAARGGMINSMIAANGGNGIAVLPEATLPGGGSISDWNNTVGMSTGEKAAYILAKQRNDTAARGNELQAEVARYGQDLRAERGAARDDVAMRGQDFALQRGVDRNSVALRGHELRADSADKRTTAIAERKGNPSLSQERSNAEIDAARERIAGMTPDEIKKKTANFTATGRENPDYDPTLAKAVAQANRRKVGDDQHFDERQQRTASQHGYERNEVASRFRAERDMAAYKLGNDTPNGVEVLDASGKIIGHYR